MSYIRLVWLFFRVSIMNELAYRGNLMMQLLQVGISLTLTLTSLAVIYSYTDTIGGWGSSELLALVGVYYVVDGMVNLVIQPSLSQLMEAIRTGSFDFTLTKPVDAQLLASSQSVEIWKVIDIGVGMALLLSALVRLGSTVALEHLLAFALTLLAGGAMIYSLLLMMATLTFWLVKIDNIMEIFQSFYDAGRWPVSIYPQWMRVALTFFVPVAFAVTLPTEALLGRLTWSSALTAVGVAIAMLLISRLFWLRGTRRYSGASA